MFQSRRVQHRITSGFINVVTESGYLPAFWAHPEIGGRFPGLVLIHEDWGLTAQIRMLVRRFAEVGFYVIAPDLFDGKTARTPQEAAVLLEQIRESAPERVDAAINALKTHNRCNGKMAIVGVQMGGELAYHMLLHRTDLRAGVIYYGRADDYLPMIATIETPILAFYGDKDPIAPPELLNALRQALNESPGHGELVVYPGDTTDFFTEEMPSYKPEDAADSWQKTLDFLTIHVDLGQEKTDTNPKVII